MNISFYGGIGEIGGNKILLESEKAKIWLDFGMSFSLAGRYYDEFMKPRKHNGFTDYFEMGLLPQLKGLYRTDMLNKSGIREGKNEYDAVFFTHAHVDHTGYLPLLNKDIPAFCGETTKAVLEAMQETGSGTFTEYITYKECFTGLHWSKVPCYKRKVNGFRTGSKIEVKDIMLEPVHVDHSIPGAYGFIVDSGGKRIVYTGDLRMHGRKPEMTYDFIEKAASEKTDALICEGTRLGEKQGLSEAQVEFRISKHIEACKGLVIANFPPRDIDRLNSFYNAAKENGRKLAVDMKQAYLLKQLENDEHLECPKLKDVLVYVKKQGDGSITETKDKAKIEKDYSKWQRDLLFMKNSVTYKDIKDIQEEVVLYLNSWSFSELIDIKPVLGSIYIYSLCEPFNDEMELDAQRRRNWLEHFNLKEVHEHASGHASGDKIDEMIKEIDAKKVFQVHSEKKSEIQKGKKYAV